MTGPSKESKALAYLFLKGNQDRIVEQKKKLKKLDKKIKKLRQIKKK